MKMKTRHYRADLGLTADECGHGQRRLRAVAVACARPVVIAVGINRHGSVGSWLGTGSRLAGAGGTGGSGLGLWCARGRVWLSQGSIVQGQLAGAGGTSEAGAVNNQGSHGSEWLGMLVTAALVVQGCGCKGSLKAGEGKMKYVKSQSQPPPPPPPPLIL